MIPTKALVRHTVRDYLDTVVRLERLGEAGARDALAAFEEIHRQESGASPPVCSLPLPQDDGLG